MAILLFLTSSAALAAPDRTLRLDIPAQPLSRALIELALEADISIGQAGFELEDVRTRPLRGIMTIGEALSRLLDGTGVTFEFVDADTVRLVRRPPAKAESLAPPRGRAASRPSAPRLEEIIVTATKRTALLERLPVSVATLSGAELERFGFDAFNRAAHHIAGVAVTNFGAGRNKLFIRGLSDGIFSDRTQSTVSIYLDEVPVTFSDPNPDLRLVDIERIEVLRGPQGTLYGAGAIGGVLRIIPRKPALELWEARIAASGALSDDGDPSARVEGTLNLPLIEDRLAGRLTAYLSQEGGYIDDVALERRNVNSATIYGARLGTHLRLGGSWSAETAAVFQKIDADDTQYFLASLGPLNRANQIAEPREDRFLNFSATLRGHVGAAELVSATALTDRAIETINDASRAVPQFAARPVAPAAFESDDDIRFLSHETRLVSPDGGRFEWLAGLAIFDRDERVEERLAILAGDERLFARDRREEAREVALFGEADVRLGSRLKLGVGLRAYWTRFSATAEMADEGAPVGARNSDVGIAPKASLAYEFGDGDLLFFRFAKGYRVGGINVNTPQGAMLPPDDDDEPLVRTFAPDRLLSYELGARTSLWNERVRASAAVFYVDWNNIQTDQLLDSGLSFVTNAGDARNLGVEAEISLSPIPDLDLAFAVFKNDPELTRANPFLGAVADNRLPGIAEISASARASYSLHLGETAEARLSAAFSHVGASRLTFAEERAPTMGNYQSLSARLELSRPPWQIFLFGENLTNDRSNSFALGNPFALASESQVTPQRPRSIGLGLRRSF